MKFDAIIIGFGKAGKTLAAGRTHKDASPVAYKSIFIDISTPIRIFMVE